MTTSSRVLCRICGTIIQSKYRHDWVRCKCPDESDMVFVDGGSDYLRMGTGVNAIYSIEEPYFVMTTRMQQDCFWVFAFDQDEAYEKARDGSHNNEWHEVASEYDWSAQQVFPIEQDLAEGRVYDPVADEWIMLGKALS